MGRESILDDGIDETHYNSSDERACKQLRAHLAVPELHCAVDLRKGDGFGKGWDEVAREKF